MKLLTRAPVLCVLLLVLPAALSAQAATTQDLAQLPAELRQTREAVNQAYTALRADQAVEYYADDIFVRFGNDEFRGRQAAAAWLQDALAGLSALRLGRSTFSITAEQVVESASYSILLPDGQQTDGTAETVWRLQNGAWKVSRMTVM